MSVCNEFRMKIKSELYEVDAELFSIEGTDLIEISEKELENHAEADIIEINVTCQMSETESSVCISYEEAEGSGMEESNTTLSFQKDNPECITMFRSGSVSAIMVFEEGKRNHTIYKTPIMPFEVSVFTKKVINNILQSGVLELDYLVEIRGARAERTKFTMQILK